MTAIRWAVAMMALPHCTQAAVPNPLWEQVWDDTSVRAYVRAVAVDSHGNTVVAGIEYNQQATSSCMYVEKRSSVDGAVAWHKTLCVAGESGSVGDVTVDGSDNVLATGNAAQNGTGVARTVKLSSDGNVAWDVRLAETSGGARIVADSSGSVFVVASLASSKSRVVRYSSAGASSWTRDFPLEFMRVKVAPNGDLLYGGYNFDPNSGASAIGRLRAADGTDLWRTDEPNGFGTIGITADSVGNAVVTGMYGPSGNRTMRTVKYAAGNGTRLWTREKQGAKTAVGYSVGVDSHDDVVVAGTADHYYTAKYRAGDGATLWEQAYVSKAPYVEVAMFLSVDPSDDVIVTGYVNADDTTYGDSDLRTLKYSGRDGGILWSVGYAGFGGFGGDEPIALRQTPNGFVLVSKTGLGASQRVAQYGRQVIATPSLQGLWWNSPPGSENGWGLNIAQQGDKLFATVYTYDSVGKATWYVMSDMQNIHDGYFTGTMAQMRGPVFSSVPFNSSLVALLTSPYSAILQFTDENNGKLTIMTGGTPTVKNITRLQFGPAPDCRLGASTSGTPNYQDLWWADPPGSESGWGLNIAHQGDTVFATWFTYDANLRPIWWVGSNAARQPDGSYSGSLQQATGTSILGAWNPAQAGQLTVGSIRLVFSDYDHGTFSYIVNGVSQQRAITRLSFSTPATRCH